MKSKLTHVELMICEENIQYRVHKGKKGYLSYILAQVLVHCCLKGSASYWHSELDTNPYDYVSIWTRDKKTKWLSEDCSEDIRWVCISATRKERRKWWGRAMSKYLVISEWFLSFSWPNNVFRKTLSYIQCMNKIFLIGQQALDRHVLYSN